MLDRTLCLWDALNAANGAAAYDAAASPNERWLEAYDRFKNTEWGVALNRGLGRALVARLGRPVRVLDIGCGTHGRFFASLALAQQECRYCSVDLAPRLPSPLGANAHVVGDAFDPETIAAIPDDETSEGYDVVILDVEPHGREFELHAALVGAGKLAREHLVVLQCIAHMNTGGPWMADRFLDQLISRRRVRDLLAVYDFHLTRDVYVAVDLDGEPGLDMDAATSPSVYAHVREHGRPLPLAPGFKSWVMYAPSGWKPGGLAISM